MRLDEFDFDLDPRRIAQQPVPERDRSRLMALDRGPGPVEHHRFADLPDLLEAGDLLVLNDTRVVPARLIGRKPSGGRVELLLLDRHGTAPTDRVWRALLRASHPPREGTELIFDRGLRAIVLKRDEENWTIRLVADHDEPETLVETVGRPPLPPYIRRPRDAAVNGIDRERYQTVYARSAGAVAAPTAGLHFTDGLLARLAERGVEIGFLTLHVGLGTFQPVRVERIEDHRIHEEWFELPESLAGAVDRVRRRGGRLIAVGTTVVRVLEHRADDSGRVAPGSGRCGLFIYPGYRFRAVDGLVTNFHLPRSTLLMLVSAFAGRERTLGAYRTAIECGYRFYSYGDAMFVRPG